ncbi:MAG: glutamate-5-semialdehyde dehydrogenase [Oscillospiraceae bacterium]|nr:glutamate-5-semialdehyde dehydrogenase [Oscillospiraceae bacterium]
MSVLEQLGLRAKEASPVLRGASTGQKNAALGEIARALREQCGAVLEANGEDIANARQNGMSAALIDRLTLTRERVFAMAEGVEQIAALPDPIGEVMEGFTRPNGLEIIKKRVPMGVIGIIYEARPNVTVDAAALCLKSGNVCLLRGGKEAIHSNMALAGIMSRAVEKTGLPGDCVLLLEDISRETAAQMMRMNGVLDVLIPRGGAGLIRSVVQNATVPVIETGTGNCHVYVDSSADLEMAEKIIVNAKAQRPSVCNAAETLLVHREVAERFLPAAGEALKKAGVTLYGCPETCRILPGTAAATEEDYATEYLDYKLAVRVVESLDEAIAHIRRYSTGHSEAIVTRDYESSRRFTAQVDSAAVYVNASTRFTDGGEFGFGAEIGISTQKLHARGPMGLREMTTYQYIIKGSGQIR